MKKNIISSIKINSKKQRGILHFLAQLHPLAPILAILLQNTIILFSARLVLLFLLFQEITHKQDIPYGLYIGLKFDVRIAVFLLIPAAIALIIPPLSRKISSRGKTLNILTGITAILVGSVFLLYIFDFGFIAYLHRHIDCGSRVFLEDPVESLTFIWQNYRVILITAAFIFLLSSYLFCFRYFLLNFSGVSASRKKHYFFSFITFFCLFVAAFGQIDKKFYPLRWMNAYFSTDRNISLIAINPVQNMFDSLKLAKFSPVAEEDARNSWPRMAKYLNLPNSAKPLTFLRHTSEKKTDAPLNIVLIIMESFAWERTSLAPPIPASLGKDIDPTPFLKELSKKSLYYTQFYAPSRTTARAVFTTITGIPDINHSGETTSRNPAFVDQSIILNEFKEYQKYYMLGGSANWANMRGVLQYNVDNLNILDFSFWKSPSVDVWGVSDISLFRYANDVLTQSTKPFIAVIQSGSFHRPYTIPKDTEGFALPSDQNKNALEWYGFSDNKEFRSLKLSDYALRRFFEKASKQPWFNNTVFAIVGDHGLNGPQKNMHPAALACELQAWHVPFLLYAPGGQIKPAVNSAPHMQIDIFPTLASIAGIEYYNSTLGKNLMDPRSDQESEAFISVSDNEMMLIKDGYVFGLFRFSEVLFSLSQKENIPVDLSKKEPEKTAELRQNALDFYYTSRYLLSNNGKEKIRRLRSEKK